ncbi:hypothetical protein GQF01_03550 [Paenibacillus sp. 5J-6]|uniref:Uncharacterized protein n=1 Tax=Paenibacillus silvestris TaxID=2606219 RepID=A0A6L8UVJ7_9BACL|nr:hypothetical protein [Paenibacillus silvestris]MZQ81196.1 hypothetical protein [Paenibacillus silvestris]
MIGKAGMICGLCILVGGVIGGLFGEKELGYELGTAACIVIMGVAVLLNQKVREKKS